MKKRAKAGEKKEAKEKAKPLTRKQRELLRLAFRFRFVTSGAVADYFGQTQTSGAWARLEKLLALGYLAKRFNGQYKLHGRSAEYYILPAARRELRLMANTSEREIKQLYNRPVASGRFVDRSLQLFSIYNQLHRLYGQRLNFVPKVALNLDDYDYLPKPLPDAFVGLEQPQGSDNNYFLDYYDDAVSLGIHARRLKLYHQYEEGTEWNATGLDFPVILTVCQSRRLAERFSQRTRRFIRSEYSSIKVLVIALDDLIVRVGPKWAIWTDPEHANDGKIAL